ncbi:MAG: endonuclease [Muribaculaceae bacterium]|nr:endonuclease [Muribaculaceae bacterium]
MIHKSLYRIAMAVLAITAWLGADATIPTGYYDSLEGKSGQALKDAIHELATRHTTLSYGSLWIYFAETDCQADDKSKVWDMYSNRTYYFRGGSSGVSGMHKEHSLPKSWWGGYDENQGYAGYTDINHLYPSDGDANMAKSNYPLGEVSNAYFDNGVTRVGAPKMGQGGGSSSVFEPDDRYKGDFARTYFYMACTYQQYTWKYTYMLNNSSWKGFNEWSIDLLCRWARNDAVSDKEIDRNDAVQKFQNNRNPFIDIPELFEYIWGNRQGQVFYLSEAGTSSDTTTYTGDPELISPTQGTVLDFGEVAIGKSLDYTVYIKGRGLNNPLSLQLYRYDYEMFSIPVTSVSRTVANSPEGYPLKITYTPTSIGEHTARLLIFDGGLVGSVGVELRARCVPVPTLSQLIALDATILTGNSYLANWRAANEEVDYYIITRTVYNKENGETRTETFTTTDGSTTEYLFEDRQPGETHTYYVQSYRLGYLSEPSNVITIDATGITGIQADKPLQLLTMEGGVLVKCSEDLGSATVYDMAGRTVRQIDNLHNDMIIDLPRGIYLLKTSTSRTAWKIAVR